MTRTTSSTSTRISLRRTGAKHQALHKTRIPGSHPVNARGKEMHLEADTELVDAARTIGQIIREHNAEAERERRLSRAVLNALYETGLLRMFTPRSLGGLEANPITRALVVEELSGHDTAAGWTLENPLDWAY